MKRTHILLFVVIVAILASVFWLRKTDRYQTNPVPTGGPIDSSTPLPEEGSETATPGGQHETGAPADGATAPSEMDSTTTSGAPTGDKKDEGAAPGKKAAPATGSQAGGGFQESEKPAPGTTSQSGGGFSEKAAPGSAATSGAGTVTSGNVPIQRPGFDTDSKSGQLPSAAGSGSGKAKSGSKAPARPTGPISAYGVKGPKVWFVASDLREIAGSAPTAEVGVPEGTKASVWLNRAGPKGGDGVRVASGTNATFVRDLSIGGIRKDAVAFCAPGARECTNPQASQIKSGPDMNHPEHWLSGSDKAGKSEKGGSSFTVLFVAARGSAVPNSLLEHQNGEANAKKAPFLGWIGPDIVGSIHGSQGIVSIAAVAAPDAWAGKPVPRIYTLRFDRRKQELKLFALGPTSSEEKSVALAKGDGPDNDQYAALTIGSKSPGNGAAQYVFEHLAYPRALENRELCKIHREWNTKYGLKVPSEGLKPCDE
jgi:hypothetical protein